MVALLFILSSCLESSKQQSNLPLKIASYQFILYTYLCLIFKKATAYSAEVGNYFSLKGHIDKLGYYRWNHWLNSDFY